MSERGTPEEATGPLAGRRTSFRTTSGRELAVEDMGEPGARVLTPRQVGVRAHVLSLYGHRVFPVRNKRPAINGWPGVGPFTRWGMFGWPFESSNQLGWVPPPGYVVLDFDVAPGGYLRDLYAAVEKSYGVLMPPERIQETSRGVHALYRIPGDENARMRARLPLLENSAGHVDVKIGPSGFVILYDPGWVLAGGEVPDLPVELLESIEADVEASVREERPRRAGGSRLPVVGGRWSGFLGVEGRRNDDLNRVVFLAELAGEMDEIAMVEVSNLALASGLPPGEVSKTIHSARKAGRRKSARQKEWLRRVTQELERDRHPEPTFRIARLIAYYSQNRGDLHPVPLAVRETAEALAISIAVASRSIRRLLDLRLLADVAVDGQARRSFLLTYPDGQIATDRSNWNSHPALPLPVIGGKRKSEAAEGAEADLQREAGLAGHEWFAGHRAFHKQPGRLGPSQKAVLWTLRDGPSTAVELASRSGISSASLRRARTGLLEAGLIVGSNEGLRLAGDDLEVMLDDFADHHGLVDIRPRIRESNALDRERYAALVDSLSAD